MSNSNPPPPPPPPPEHSVVPQPSPSLPEPPIVHSIVPPAPPQSEQIHTLPSPKKAKRSITATTATSSASGSGSGKHPLYRGIRSRSGKWVSEIREPKKTTRVWLGTYPSPEMAAAAYDVAALALKGKNTLLNFPDDVSKYPVPDSPSPQDIRKAASTAALLKKPEEPLQLVNTADSSKVDNIESDQVEVVKGGEKNEEFEDIEELLDMPNLLRGMAEGMLVSPPRMGSSQPSDDSPSNSDAENLWSF